MQFLSVLKHSISIGVILSEKATGFVHKWIYLWFLKLQFVYFTHAKPQGMLCKTTITSTEWENKTKPNRLGLAKLSKTNN